MGVRVKVDFSLCADGPRGLQAVHVRHLHVHQDQVEALAVGAFQRLPAGRGGHHVVPAPFQQPRRQPLVDRIILGQQNAQPAARPMRCSAFSSWRRLSDFHRYAGFAGVRHVRSAP